jgi:hypothetical protein
MSNRLNNPESCICCARRANGLAVGRPDKLGWFCKDCNVDLAKKALHMKNRDFDTLEKLAAEQVASQAGDGDITLTPQEMPDFIVWAVKSFADTMRQHVEDGKAPF